MDGALIKAAINICLSALLLNGCDRVEDYCVKRLVDLDYYQTKRECWVDKFGRFNAFVLLTKSGEAFFVTPISKFCRSEVYGSEEAFIYQYRSPVLVKNLIISGNVYTNSFAHHPRIGDNDKLFEVIGVAEIESSAKLTFRFDIVPTNRKIDMNFDEFMILRSKCIFK